MVKKVTSSKKKTISALEKSRGSHKKPLVHKGIKNKLNTNETVDKYLFLKTIPYILGAILVAMLKYKDVGGVVAVAIGDAYVKENVDKSNKNFIKNTKYFISRVVDILSTFDKLELLAFSSSLYAFFFLEIPKIIQSSQNIKHITYGDIYQIIFAKLLTLRDTYGNKLGMKHEKMYPLR